MSIRKGGGVLGIGGRRSVRGGETENSSRNFQCRGEEKEEKKRKIGRGRGARGTNWRARDLRR